MDELPIQAIKREDRLSDRVARELENLIVSGVLRPGQKLPAERELAAMFGVSRTVVREAIQSLTAKGLLGVRTGAGTVVRGPSMDSVVESLRLLLRSRANGFAVEHLHEVRRVLECAIAARAATCATEEDLEDLGDILARMERAEGDSETSAQLDVEFHRALAVAAHNPLYIILLDSIGDLLLEIRRMSLQSPADVDKALHHHRNVLECVETRDPDLARQAMSEHIDEAEETMSEILRTRGRQQTLFQVPRDEASDSQD